MKLFKSQHLTFSKQSSVGCNCNIINLIGRDSIIMDLNENNLQLVIGKIYLTCI